MPPALAKQLQVWHLALGMVVTLLTCICTAAMAWQSVQDRLGTVEVRSASVEARVAGMSEDMSRVKVDAAATRTSVEWIAKMMGKPSVQPR